MRDILFKGVLNDFFYNVRLQRGQYGFRISILNTNILVESTSYIDISRTTHIKKKSLIMNRLYQGNAGNRMYFISKIVLTKKKFVENYIRIHIDIRYFSFRIFSMSVVEKYKSINWNRFNNSHNCNFISCSR